MASERRGGGPLEALYWMLRWVADAGEWPAWRLSTRDGSIYVMIGLVPDPDSEFVYADLDEAVAVERRADAADPDEPVDEPPEPEVAGRPAGRKEPGPYDWLHLEMFAGELLYLIAAARVLAPGRLPGGLEEWMDAVLGDRGYGHLRWDPDQAWVSPGYAEELCDLLADALEANPGWGPTPARRLPPIRGEWTLVDRPEEPATPAEELRMVHHPDTTPSAPPLPRARRTLPP